jgi:hypothetical protein
MGGYDEGPRLGRAGQPLARPKRPRLTEGRLH